MDHNCIKQQWGGGGGYGLCPFAAFNQSNILVVGSGMVKTCICEGHDNLSAIVKIVTSFHNALFLWIFCLTCFGL